MDLKKLEYGLPIRFKDDSTRNMRFFALIGVFDKPARANMIQYNENFGCLQCLQKGL